MSGLDFGQGFFKQKEDDGTFARKNIQINRDDVQPVLQNEGDMILWERGNGFIYDEYDSSIDTNKWDITEDVTGNGNITVTEDATKIRGIYSVTGSGASTGNCIIATKDLPELIDLSEFNVRMTQAFLSGSAGGIFKVTIFGIVVFTETTSGIFNKDSVWSGVKKPDGTWDISEDGVFDQNINPTDNIIESSVSSNSGTFTTHYSINVFEIKIGGGSFLLLKSTQRTFVIDLTSF